MNEAEAYTQLKAILGLALDKSPANTQQMQQTIAELADILKEKGTLLADEYQKISQYSHEILDQSVRIMSVFHVQILRKVPTLFAI